MTAQETLNGKYCNVNKCAGDAAIRYGANIHEQVRDEYDLAKERISIRYQQQKDAQTMEEKEAALREQIDMIEQQLKDMQEKNIKERRKRYLISGVLGIVITLFVFVVCNKFWGDSLKTYIVSITTGTFGILGGIVTLNDFLKMLANFFKKSRRK